MTLTDTQADVLRFVVSYRDENQCPPSRRDICKHFGWASDTAAMSHLEALERKGYVRIKPGQSRGIFVVKDAAEAA